MTERLGLGPDDVMARNPRIVYGRLTGWGQHGPLAPTAGHSLNYEAITGVIRAIGPAGGPPVPLLQIIGDFAGGGLLMAYGVVCALLEAQRSGKGQVVDAAMVDGTMSLLAPYYGMAESGFQTDEMGANLFDGGAPFYNVYETADAKYVSVAPIEPHFYALLLDKMGLAGEDLPGPERSSPVARAARSLRRSVPHEDARRMVRAARRNRRLLRAGADVQRTRSYPHHVDRDCFRRRPARGRDLAPPEPHTGDPHAPSPAYPGADTDTVLADYGFSTSRDRRPPRARRDS